MTAPRIILRNASIAVGDELARTDLALSLDGLEVGDVESSPDARDVDAAEFTAIPGLIDIQVNGGWGHDLTRTPEAVWDIGRHLAAVGVTAWLPTLVSADAATRQHAVEVLDAGPPDRWAGAIPLGWHFEGPWISEQKRGAHPASSIVSADADREHAERAALVTIAPETAGAMSLIEDLAGRGIVVSIGHTNADAATVREALNRGATMGTHLFNAMTGLDHRAPGAAAALLDGQAWLGLIVDGHHVAPELVRLVWAGAPDRLVLVSDAMAATGLDPGTSTLSDSVVHIADGAARLDDGTLAGSVITLLDAVHNLMDETDCGLAAATRCASMHPAHALGLFDRGALATGKRADVAVLDSTGHVAATFVGGVCVHSNPETWIGES